MRGAKEERCECMNEECNYREREVYEGNKIDMMNNGGQVVTIEGCPLRK